MSTELIIAVIGPSAALAGVFVGSALRHASQVSNFRQEWLYKLRELFVLAIERMDCYHYHIYSGASRTQDDCAIREEFIKNDELRFQVDSAALLIRLHLNKHEREHQHFLASLTELVQLAISQAAHPVYEKKKEAVISELQDILKAEWNRVKMGELRWFIKQLPLD